MKWEEAAKQLGAGTTITLGQWQSRILPWYLCYGWAQDAAFTPGCPRINASCMHSTQLWSRAACSSHFTAHHLTSLWKFNSCGSTRLIKIMANRWHMWSHDDTKLTDSGLVHNYCKCSSVNPAWGHSVNGPSVFWPQPRTPHSNRDKAEQLGNSNRQQEATHCTRCARPELSPWHECFPDCRREHRWAKWTRPTGTGSNLTLSCLTDWSCASAAVQGTFQQTSGTPATAEVEFKNLFSVSTWAARWHHYKTHHGTQLKCCVWKQNPQWQISLMRDQPIFKTTFSETIPLLNSLQNNPWPNQPSLRTTFAEVLQCS